MSKPTKRELITDLNSDAMFTKGFDAAIIGYDAAGSCCVYDYDKCLQILIGRDEMDYSEAHEFMEDVVGYCVGDFPPIYIHWLN